MEPIEQANALLQRFGYIVIEGPLFDDLKPGDVVSDKLANIYDRSPFPHPVVVIGETTLEEFNEHMRFNGLTPVSDRGRKYYRVTAE